MNRDSQQALIQAFTLLPYVPNSYCLAQPLCTLLYLKAWSDSWHWHAAALQKASTPPSEFAAAMVQRGVLTMPADALFETCLAAPADAAVNAIQQALRAFGKANPTLEGILQPLQFGYLKGLYGANPADHKTFVKLLPILSRVSFEHRAPSSDCGLEFASAIKAICQNHNARAQAVASLFAKLLAPKANEVVFDFACGQGHLLHACAQELSQTQDQNQPQATLQLHGMEDDINQWALANMLLSLSGVAHQHIDPIHALSKPFNDLTDAEKTLALGGADIVVMTIPEANIPWGHALAFAEQDPRFPVRAPASGSLALVWQGLAALKPEVGRMALIMPIAVLAATGGYTLCKYLVDHNLLDAVITLPGMAGQFLLMIRRQKRQTDIAFIVAQGRDTQGTANALQAYQHYQSEQHHPRLICLAQSTVAANHYQLNLQMYGAAGSAFYAQAMATVLPY